MKVRLNKKTWIITGIVAVIVIELAAIGWWAYDHNRTEPVPKETTSSQQAAYKTIASLSDDLGLKLDEKLGADLVYVKDGNSYSFSSKALMDKTGGSDGPCRLYYSPVGGITPVEKSALSDPSSFYTESDMQAIVKNGSAKEFATYYLLYESPQESCSPPGNQAGSDQQIQDTALLKKVFDSIHE
jgi:hypothetical protein